MIAIRGNRTFQRIAPNDAINPKRIYDKPSMTRGGRASNRDNSLLRCMSPLLAKTDIQVPPGNVRFWG